MDTSGCHSFSFPIEAFFQSFIGVDVVRSEGANFFPISKCDCEKCFSMVSDLKLFPLLPLGIRYERAFANVIRLSMEFCREKVERIMGKGESGAAFVDAAFAKDDGLAASSEGVTDDLPFLEGGGHIVKVSSLEYLVSWESFRKNE